MTVDTSLVSPTSPTTEQAPDNLPASDYLSKMFSLQRELMEKWHELEEVNGSPVVYQEDEGDLDSRQVQARLHELYGYTVRELSEAMQELKNKPWKRTEKATNVRAFVEEVGDTMHFMVEFCITAGISPKDLYESFARTQIKNVNRQNSNY